MSSALGVIIPRWEWRTFGSRFGIAEARFAAMTPGAVQESDEVYLVGGAGDNVKVRADLMDIKVLRETDAAGLERWEPVMKAGFPLAASDVAKVFEALRLPVPTLARGDYTLDQFVDELVAPSGVLRAVSVHKRRVRYTVGGCTSEVSDVTVDGIPTRTIAIESEDAAAVTAAVASVGLGGYDNMSYPVGLRAVARGPAGALRGHRRGHELGQVRRRGAVPGRDAAPGRRPCGAHAPRRGPRSDRRDLARGDDEDGGRHRGHGRPRRASSAFARWSPSAPRGCASPATATTSCARSASGPASPSTVIPGEEESRLAYIAVLAGLGLKDEPVVVFDTGGGSTQLTFGHGTRVDERFSVEVGAVRFTEQFGLAGAVSVAVLDEARAAIAEGLARVDGHERPETLFGIGGAVTNLTAVKHALAVYDPDVVQGTVLERDEIDRQIELYRTRDTEARRSIVGLQPKRADVILAGALIVRTVMDKLGSDALTVSDRGLRHGVLAERFGN